MSVIIIGNEYKEEFESICRLFQGGLLSRGVNIVSADESAREIRTATRTFVLDPTAKGVGGSVGEQERTVFGKDGAGWFAPLRGTATDSSSAEWGNLINDVASDYHKNFSLIEFSQKKSAAEKAAEMTLAKDFTDNFLRRAFSGAALSDPKAGMAESESIYGVSMRLEIGSGVGESQPVIGDIYFRRVLGALVPLSREESYRVREFIDRATKESAGDDGQTKEGIIEPKLVFEIEQALKNSISEKTFASSVRYDSCDEVVLKRMLDHLANNADKHLECNAVKVLGVSHVQWERCSFTVDLGGTDMLKIDVGLGGALSVRCLRCKDSPLIIDNNAVSYETEQGKGVVYLDSTDREFFGADDETVSMLKEYSEIANHIVRVQCKENPRNPDCTRYGCASTLVEVGSEHGKIFKCRDCGYPEIIYNDIFSARTEGKYTPSLNISAKELTLAEGPVTLCPCCGRTFVNAKEKEGESENGKTKKSEAKNRTALCPLCADTSAPTEENFRLYRKYKGILSVWVRLKAIFAKKYCREEDNIILFVLGGKRYVFDKLGITENGYIGGPKEFGGDR